MVRTGQGKTHLASALVNRFCSLGRAARYVTTARFFIELQSTFGKEDRTKEHLIDRYTRQRYELLVLDEFEVRNDTPWENTTLRSLIDARYGHMVATVLITNLSPEDLQDRLSRAERDRIREAGGIVDCDWGSLRRFAAGDPRAQ